LIVLLMRKGGSRVRGMCRRGRRSGEFSNHARNGFVALIQEYIREIPVRGVAGGAQVFAEGVEAVRAGFAGEGVGSFDCAAEEYHG
jgi:hypothetical protein